MELYTTGIKQILLIEVPSTKVIEILSAKFTNMTEEVNAQIECEVNRCTVKGTPVSTITPKVEKSEEGDAASGCTLYGWLSSSDQTYGSAGFLDRAGSPSLMGYHYDPLPEERQIIKPSGLVGLRITEPPPNPFKGFALIRYREMG